MTSWTILCDFDGTISTCDVTDVLLERFAGPGWEELEHLWRAGKIGSRECMAGQVALFDASADELDKVVDAVEIDPWFSDFVTQARLAGARIVVVSDGLDRVIKRILHNHGLGDLPVTANHLVQVGSRSWQSTFPNRDDSCRSGSGNCKCAFARGVQGADRGTLLVGDGRSDFCVAGRVDFVFAKDSLLEHCRRAGLPHAPISNFNDAALLLPSVLRGALLPPPSSHKADLLLRAYP